MSELPEGWCQACLGDLGTWSSGGTPSRKNKDYFGDGIPWVKTGDLRDSAVTEVEESITELGLKNSSAKVFPVGTLLVAMYGATIGRTGLLTIPAATNQACAAFLPDDQNHDTIPYLWWYLRGSLDQLRALGQGGAQPNISQTLLKKFQIPIPPLAEQRRIVAKLDRLFERTRRAREELSHIPRLIENYKKAILATAFRGNLTKDWNKAPLLDIADIQLGKMLDRSKNRGSPKKYLRNINVRWGAIDTSDLKEMLFADEENEKFSVRDRDLFVCEGGEPGRCAIWGDGETDIKFQKAIHRIRMKNGILPEIISYQLMLLSVSGELSKYLTGTTIKHLTRESLGKIDFIFSYNEVDQSHLVDFISNSFQKIEIIEREYFSAERLLHYLDQANLAKAFRGELVPQDPNDEPASVLLERIREERAGQPKLNKIKEIFANE